MPASEKELTRLRADAQNSLFFPVTPTMVEVFEQDTTVALVYAFFRFATFQGERAVELTTEQIAAKTRLSVKQIKRARGVLVGGGYIESVRRDKWDSTCSFSLPAKSDPVGTTQDGPQGSAQGDPTGTSLPYIEELKQEENQEAPPGGELILFNQRLPKSGNTALLTDGFEEFWSMAVRKTSKASARKAYLKACGKVGRAALMDSWAAFNRVWAAWPADRRQYIPHPSTWLNDERWEDSLPDDPATESWGAFAERVQAAADDWYAAQDVPSPTYSVEQITATVVSETSGWG